jgi:hypothetical protein
MEVDLDKLRREHNILLEAFAIIKEKKSAS